MTPHQAVVDVIAALDACDLPYMLVGSFSTNVYGVERSTKDVDLLVELGDTSILDLTRHLPPAIRIDPQMSFETVTMTRRYIANVEGTPFQVEFFLLGDDPHDQERFRRRVRARDRDGRLIVIPTPEDVIITKLRWALLGGRSKDRDDARDVIAVQDVEGRIDWDYVHAWCERHGTRALLDEVRRSIPPI
jgi:hypothetical protein